MERIDLDLKENLLLKEALLFEEGHLRRTPHIVMVQALTRMLGIQAGLDERQLHILQAAAILHDIAIKACKEQFQDACQENQRRLAPGLTADFLESCGYPKSFYEPVLELVLTHHCYQPGQGLLHQLLIEADLIVGCWEAEKPGEKARLVLNYFETDWGTALLRQLT